MDTVLGELQVRNLGAAERLMQLSIDHGLGVTAVLAALAGELFELNLRHWHELAAADERERLRLRAAHAERIAERLVAGAARIAALGSEVRAGFSRLLTEQLAAGNHGLMDAFQGFFAVLPVQGADFPQMLTLAVERSERALGEVANLLAQATAPVPAAPPAVPKKELRARAGKDAPPPPPAAAALATDASAV